MTIWGPQGHLLASPLKCPFHILPRGPIPAGTWLVTDSLAMCEGDVHAVL